MMLALRVGGESGEYKDQSVGEGCADDRELDAEEKTQYEVVLSNASLLKEY